LLVGISIVANRGTTSGAVVVVKVEVMIRINTVASCAITLVG
jgi:hypothetical protein